MAKFIQGTTLVFVVVTRTGLVNTNVAKSLGIGETFILADQHEDQVAYYSKGKTLHQARYSSCNTTW